MYSTAEVIRLTDVSVRQLDTWTTNDVIKTIGDKNPGNGYHRKYHRDEIDKIRLLVKVAHALNHTYSYDLLKKVVENQHRGSIDLGDNIILTWG